MLSYITWTIKNKELHSVIIATSSGVGYEIIINELIYSQIHNKNEVEMFLYHNITENGQSLFWFLHFEERVLFKELIKISWVGWKVAQTLLSLWTSRLKKAILENDKNTLESIKWVGKKMAEKILLELKDKDIIKNSEFLNQEENKKDPIHSHISTNLKSEILWSLTLMGYNTRDIEHILNNLPEWLNSLEKIIPYIIKNM